MNTIVFLRYRHRRTHVRHRKTQKQHTPTGSRAAGDAQRRPGSATGGARKPTEALVVALWACGLVFQEVGYIIVIIIELCVITQMAMLNICLWAWVWCWCWCWCVQSDFAG